MGPASRKAPLLELSVATVVRGGATILKEVSLSIGVGEHTVVLGPNGSGKSSLIKLLTGNLYPLARPDGPAPVRILGRERWNLAELRSRLGVVSPDLHQRFVAGSSMGRVTGLEAVLAGFFGSEVLFVHHPVDDGMRERALTALARVEAAELADRRIDRMSTGEVRRILIARALVHEPPVLVLDEPTTGLDVVARYDFLDRLRRLAEVGPTLVVVTHHVEEILPETRRVVLLSRGRILANGPPDEVLSEELLSAAFGAPLELDRRGDRYRLRPASPPVGAAAPAGRYSYSDTDR